MDRCQSMANEYTSPLEGRPYHRSRGIICAVDRYGAPYTVSRIDYERFDDQRFQYVFTPEWSVIDALPPSLFQGIPGLDLSLRLKRYYRVNMTPVFISERTPGEGREDLWELLASVGLDYYDRFEWLLRTRMHCGTDNLIVKRARDGGDTFSCDSAQEARLEDLQPEDCVSIDSLQNGVSSNRALRTYLLRILRTGSRLRLEAEERTLTKEECGAMLKLLLLQDSLDRSGHRGGAEKSGCTAPKKKRPFDRYLWTEIIQELNAQSITEEEAMARLRMDSRPAFRRQLKKIQTLLNTEQHPHL